MFPAKDAADHTARPGFDWRGGLIPAVTLGLAALIGLGGDAARAALRYDREAILAGGEVWRLVSGHLAHLGWSHWALNGVGMILVWLLVGPVMSSARWLVVFAGTLAGIDLGFLLLQPGLDWYVGLSGLLHGVLAAGLVAGYRRRPLECAAIGVGLAVKLAYEHWAGPVPGSAEAAGGTVIVAAHLYGALAGAVSGLAVSVGRGRDRRI